MFCLWEKGEDDEQDRKDSALVSSLCSFISDIHDEIWKFTRFELRCGNYDSGFRVQVERSVWQLDIWVLRGEV